ncbi:DNA adenine methylase [Nitratireductor aquimarinus]|uniref:site-specific DNA-methyltransferase (adenine-specific) n=1 Tax=Nitratireductor aquimarinus TaxID=889300 RepID=A0ABU4AJA8_9HYPH|nr:DNA adenine methylase [Nitratireductor aquimarinus]MDV6226327.1 DNA adenine methylase [Nitratireductor aquimarinus]
MSNFSPLRYPGGKGTLAPYMREIIEKNDLMGGTYAEPFAGGAGIALDLLFSGYVARIEINDIDPCIHAFWHSVVYETDAMVDQIHSTDVNIENWLSAREIKRHHQNHSRLEVGFATFLLNRTNRSGILNGGVIGGLSQSGKWKLDCRYNKDELADRIRRIGFHRPRISVSKLDANQFIKKIKEEKSEKYLIYIDPPYYIKGGYLYQNHFKHDDHVNLYNNISTLDKKWIASYDNVEQIRTIYKKFKQEQFNIGYSARNHSMGTEVMIFSDKISRPNRVYSSLKQKRALCA